MNKTIKAGALSLLLFCTVQSFAAADTNPQTPKSIPTNTQSAKININTASAKQLIHQVKGIGIKRAESIVKYREEHGAFSSLNDLADVPGLGERFIASHRKALEEKFTI